MNKHETFHHALFNGTVSFPFPFHITTHPLSNILVFSHRIALFYLRGPLVITTRSLPLQSEFAVLEDSYGTSCVFPARCAIRILLVSVILMVLVKQIFSFSQLSVDT
jgi:hypothetical protein